MVWRRSIFPTTSSASPIPTAAVSGRRHPRGCPLLAIVRFGGWKSPLKQSTARCHLSSNADCFSEPLQNFSFSDHYLPVFYF